MVLSNIFPPKAYDRHLEVTISILKTVVSLKDAMSWSYPQPQEFNKGDLN